MAARPPRPPETPWLSPYLTVKDSDAGIDFYVRAFGFRKQTAMPGPDGRTAHAEMRWQDALIMFGPEHTCKDGTRAPASSGTLSPVTLYVYCDDVDALFERARAAGAMVVDPPGDMFWGDRVCKLRDPDGYVWCFATNVADFDPSKAPA
jgi:uncharacterized glyoxalase superfamily protein PhnB